MKPLTNLQYQLLTAIFQCPGLHGYQLLSKHIAHPSSVYEALRILSSRGYIRKRMVTSEQAPAKNMFTITKAGRAKLLHFGEEYDTVLHRMRRRYLTKLMTVQSFLP